MGKLNKTVVSVTTAVAGVPILAGCYAGYQKLRYSRSAKAGLTELYLNNKYKKFKGIDEKKRLEQQKANNAEELIDISKVEINSSIITKNKDDRAIWYLNSNSDSNIAILYIHGGSYVHNLADVQWQLADKVALESNAEVIIPDYGLAPFYTYKDSYKLITDLYTEYLKENPEKTIYIMGDSAGGGLALGIVQSFVKNGTPLPKGLILLSPWVDLTMKNPEIKKYIKKDPLLSIKALLADALSWAGDKDLADWMISPINGNLEGLPKVLLFTGTRELIYPDTVILADKLKNAGVNTTFEIGKNLNHVYPAFPIPEAKVAIEKIADFVKI